MHLLTPAPEFLPQFDSSASIVRVVSVDIGIGITVTPPTTADADDAKPAIPLQAALIVVTVSFLPPVVTTASRDDERFSRT